MNKRTFNMKYQAMEVQKNRKNDTILKMIKWKPEM